VTQQAYQRVVGADPSHFKGPQLPVETVNWNEAQSYCQAVGMRLPTEAEWEYAARAGSTGSRYGAIDAIAWYSGNSGGTTHPVGLKQANAFGLYDMLGNVYDWTSDNYNANSKVVRGGSWNLNSGVVRASLRDRFGPSVRGNSLGFRCVGELR
jgi:sulfatase modifying factor 1